MVLEAAAATEPADAAAMNCLLVKSFLSISNPLSLIDSSAGNPLSAPETTSRSVNNSIRRIAPSGKHVVDYAGK